MEGSKRLVYLRRFNTAHPLRSTPRLSQNYEIDFRKLRRQETVSANARAFRDNARNATIHCHNSCDYLLWSCNGSSTLPRLA
jgi:hypothetical protein